MAQARRNPVPLLCAVAFVPAVALGAIWRAADARAGDSAPPTTAAVVDAQPPIALATPLLSVRRSPGVLARDVNVAAFVDAAQPFLASLNSTSCVAMSIDGQPVAARNAEVSLLPASNVKLITGAVALEVLGPEFVFTTRVAGSFDRQSGTVGGDLYFIGGGDPNLSEAWWPQSKVVKFPTINPTSMEALADSIVAAGVRSVSGSVVGDATYFDDEFYPPVWGEGVRFVEGGPVSALIVNDLRLSPESVADDPAVGAASILTKLLQERGVTVAGPASKGDAPEGQTEIATITSLPLTEVLEEMLFTSDNTSAELLLKQIGLTAGGAGTREAGLAVVNSTLAAWGVPMDGVTLVDGSGLSVENRITCAALLAVVQHGSVDDAVGQGLPVAGAEGGTLAGNFADSSLSGVLRAKTGTLYNYDDGTGGLPGAKSLSGYVPLGGGSAIEFALVLNGPTIAENVEYEPIWNAFADLAATYVGAGPTPDELAPR